jgi:zinc protease
VTPVDRSVLPTPAATLAFRFPRVYRHVLANGLEVRAVPHHNVPVLSSALLVRGGTASDPADRPGLAAFTADLLDEGSAGKDALEVSEAIARLGADLDVDVGPDAVVVSLTWSCSLRSSRCPISSRTTSSAFASCVSNA